MIKGLGVRDKTRRRGDSETRCRRVVLGLGFYSTFNVLHSALSVTGFNPDLSLPLRLTIAFIETMSYKNPQSIGINHLINLNSSAHRVAHNYPFGSAKIGQSHLSLDGS
jgi:hypothetical protein